MGRVLKLDQSGMPRRWVSVRQAAEYYAHDKVLWELADETIQMLGGHNSDGLQSALEISPIIAVSGKVHASNFHIPLTNETLFSRDEYTCQYCGQVGGRLTRDHVIPRGQGGPDVWTNVVTACHRCNSHKGCRTPAQAGLMLLAGPYKPNWYELIYLRNRKGASDYQLDYLQTGFDNLKV